MSKLSELEEEALALESELDCEGEKSDGIFKLKERLAIINSRLQERRDFLTTNEFNQVKNNFEDLLNTFEANQNILKTVSTINSNLISQTMHILRASREKLEDVQPKRKYNLQQIKQSKNTVEFGKQIDAVWLSYSEQLKENLPEYARGTSQ